MTLPEIYGPAFLKMAKLSADDERAAFCNKENIQLLNFVLFEGTASFPK